MSAVLACCSLVVAAQAVVSQPEPQPDLTQPAASQHAVLTVQGRGSQTYRCQPVGEQWQWSFLAPAARLFDANGNEVGTHGDGPTWMALDSSSVQGTVMASVPSPDAGSVPWLLLKARNPQRTGVLTTVEWIRRSATKGGTAPAAGCDASHRGDLVRVPYSATYTFYSSAPAAPGASGPASPNQPASPNY